MFPPSMPEEEYKRKNTSPDDSVYGLPAVVLLSKKQWLYIERRYHMSPREIEVAKLVCRGFINGEIAERLNVKPGTVKTHLRSIFGKTHAKNKITMLLRFIGDINKFFGDPARTAPIPIVDTEKPTQRKPSPDEILDKE